MAVLSEPFLPPKEKFYSSLKSCNVLENQTRVAYEKLVFKENKNEKEALALLNIKTVPKSTIDENYQLLKDIWEEQKMSTFRDFLQQLRCGSNGRRCRKI